MRCMIDVKKSDVKKNLSLCDHCFLSRQMKLFFTPTLLRQKDDNFHSKNIVLLYLFIQLITLTNVHF